MRRPQPHPAASWGRVSRRGALRAFASLAVVGSAGASRCAQAPPQPEAVSVPLAELPPGRRRVVQYAGEPVELRMGEQGAVARVLVCTHYGCVVAWRDADGAYVCPCHAGRFDADGVPVMGPPPRPLRSVPVAVVGDRLRVGG